MNTNIKINVIGSGVVGSATGKGFVQKGFDVTFLDVSPETIKKLKDQGYTAYTIDEYADMSDDSDISIFTVPTPTVQGKVVLDYLLAASKSLGLRMKNKSKYSVVVTRSTLPPGTTRGLIVPEIEKYSGKTAGEDFGVCMNPEYLREVSAESDFANPWAITIGQLDEKSGDLLAEVFKPYDIAISRMKIEEAEMQKYIHNLYNAVKIAYFNEFRVICDQMNLDAQKIFDAVVNSCEGMWNPKYGTKNLGPYSGMCLPKDTTGFYTWAKERGYDVNILKSAIDANEKYTELWDSKKLDVSRII